MSLSNPPNSSPATIDIDKILDEILDRFSKAHPFADTRAYNFFHEAAKAQLTDLITEKENRARVAELKNLKNIDCFNAAYSTDPRPSKLIDIKIRELEAILKSKGRTE